MLLVEALWCGGADELQAQKDLHSYQFERSPYARYMHWFILLVMLGLALLVVLALQGTLVRLFPFLSALVVLQPQEGSDLVAPTVTIFGAATASLMALQQFRAARNEISLDKFYDRLETVNKVMDSCECAHDSAGALGRYCYAYKMYVYRELDNLEYAIAKYRIGFMSHSNAHRALRTFRSRCTYSARFREVVEHCATDNLGYDQVTQKVVKQCLKEAARETSNQLHLTAPPCDLCSVAKRPVECVTAISEVIAVDRAPTSQNLDERAA